jgi:predicted Zn-ribbon and HTH transcriptional regulator
MENPNLAELQQILTNNTEEAASIRADLDKANELLKSCNQRLIKLVGAPSPKAKSLKEYIKQVLDNSNEPLTVKEIAELVLENGYKTTSAKNFRNIVLQALLNDAVFKRKTRPKTKPARFAHEGV